MAKSKSEKESFDAFIKREYGENIIQTADTIIDRPRQIIPTTLSLDLSLSGGIPEGITCLISGKPSAGKTTLCLHIIANAIKLGRPAFYIDVERRCKKSLLETIEHLDPNKLQIVRNEQETFSAEQWLTIIEHIIKNNPNAIIIIDSVVAMSTQKELSDNYEDSDMAGIPKLLSRFFRRTPQIIDNNNVILICISRLMTNREQHGKKWIEKGGVDIQHAASVWLNVTYAQKWPKDTHSNSVLGQDMNIDVVKSALGKPYLPCCIPLRYGKGIDKIADIRTNAENFAMITKAGAWYSIPSFGPEKYQGTENLDAFLRDNPEKLETLEKNIRSIVFESKNP